MKKPEKSACRPPKAKAAKDRSRSGRMASTVFRVAGRSPKAIFMSGRRSASKKVRTGSSETITAKTIRQVTNEAP